LSLQRPRRIFRGSSLLPGGGFVRLFGFVMAGAGILLALTLTGLSTDLFGRATNQKMRLEAAGAAVAVVDGETLRLGDTVVRLAGIRAPERGRSCSGGTGGVQDCGVAAANALAGLVRTHPVACELRGRDGLRRSLAACTAGSTDLSLALLAAGWAEADQSSGDFAAAERAAQAAQRGLWAGNGSAGR
jgi:endonuclease YncB( thermonuclease family)